MSDLVLGLGNPILGDDGVGWRVADEVRRLLGNGERAPGGAADVEVDCVAVGGLGLMERMLGHERVVIADAMVTGRRPPGAVDAFPLSRLEDPGAGHTRSAHDVSLPGALAAARALGATCPREVFVVSVEIRETLEFSERLTPIVAAAVPRAARTVLEVLRGGAEQEGASHGVTRGVEALSVLRPA